jgi:integrase
VRKLTTAWKRLEPLHHVRMEQLTIDLMQRVIDEATSTYYPARDMKIMLSHLMDEAVKREIIPRNKTDYIELPELKESKKDAFNRDEIRQIWDSWHSGDRMAGVVLMMIYTGMRKGELMTIQRKNIYLDKRYMIGGIKTEAGIDRVIAIPAEIADVMEQLLADSTSPTPFSMSTDDFYDSYYATLERSGVRRLNPHCCRHTFFTWLIASGVDSVIAAEMGGHADISMTKQYTHTPIDAKIAAADRLRLQP